MCGPSQLYGPALIARFMGPTWGPIWGRQDPGGPHVGPMNFAIWVIKVAQNIFIYTHFITSNTYILLGFSCLLHFFFQSTRKLCKIRMFKITSGASIRFRMASWATLSVAVRNKAGHTLVTSYWCDIICITTWRASGKYHMYRKCKYLTMKNKMIFVLRHSL